MQLKINKFWKIFLNNLKSKAVFIHIFWVVLLIVITVIIIFLYQNKINYQDEVDFKRQNITAGQTVQYFDDRVEQQDEEKNSNKIWGEVGGSPFTEFTEAGVLNGQVAKDILSGLVWSSRSAKSLTNKFIIDETKGIAGGEAFLFCDNLNKIKYAGYQNWRLPVQKQLMQAYIDGASRNLKNVGYVWSATEFLGDSGRAWIVNFNAGDVASYKKLNSSSAYAICVAQD